MKNSVRLAAHMVLITMLCSACGDSKQKENNQNAASSIEQKSVKTMNIQIILGSTRQGRTSDKIGKALKHTLDKRSDITTEIIDLRDYNLPFLNDEVAPASRETITDPLVQRWSEKIQQGDGFIIVVPEYNAGYPGVLKNALDSLYKEWNNKPIAFVGYSGGSSGGKNAIAQMHQVALGLEMVPMELSIKIPSAWKALDTKGALINTAIEQELNTMVDQLMRNKKNK